MTKPRDKLQRAIDVPWRERTPAQKALVKAWKDGLRRQATVTIPWPL